MISISICLNDLCLNRRFIEQENIKYHASPKHRDNVSRGAAVRNEKKV